MSNSTYVSDNEYAEMNYYEKMDYLLEVIIDKVAETDLSNRERVAEYMMKEF